MGDGLRPPVNRQEQGAFDEARERLEELADTASWDKLLPAIARVFEPDVEVVDSVEKVRTIAAGDAAGAASALAQLASDLASAWSMERLWIRTLREALVMARLMTPMEAPRSVAWGPTPPEVRSDVPGIVAELTFGLAIQSRPAEALEVITANWDLCGTDPELRYRAATLAIAAGDIAGAKEFAASVPDLVADAGRPLAGQLAAAQALDRFLPSGEIGPRQFWEATEHGSVLLTEPKRAEAVVDFADDVGCFAVTMKRFMQAAGHLRRQAPAVLFVDDRDSVIVGRVLGGLLDVPVVPYGQDRSGLVVQCRGASGGSEVQGVWQALPHQPLYVHALDPTRTWHVTPEFIGRYAVEYRPMWDGDLRTPEVIASEILSAVAAADWERSAGPQVLAEVLRKRLRPQPADAGRTRFSRLPHPDDVRTRAFRQPNSFRAAG